MSSIQPLAVRRILAAEGIRPNRKMGQNFLVDRRLLERIAGFAEGGSVLEIGAGPGNLTIFLADRAVRVVAVEVDGRLFPLLVRATGGCANVEPVPQDILDCDLPGLLAGPHPWVCISNLPYSASSPILFRLLDHAGLFADLYLTLQTEVAERLASCPGSRRYGRLSVTAGLVADGRVLFRLPAAAFYPRPEVESAFVHLRPHRRHLERLRSRAVFEEVVRAAFGQRRKQIRSALRGFCRDRPSAPDPATVLARAGIDPTARPEEVDVSRYVDLANELTGLSDGPAPAGD